MLPKVATHILHSTSRAAAAVQNQTHTIRNVLHSSSSPAPTSLGPWNGPSSSSSGGSSSNGPGPGGQKFTGSRFHTGYSNAGRAVTQANAITSQDGSVGQTDDSDDLPGRRVSIQTPRRSRPRSHSLSAQPPPELGVLKTVQLHARSKHAFAGRNSTSVPVEDPPVHILVRRNSTSVSPEPLDRPHTPVRRNSTSSSDEPTLPFEPPRRPATPHTHVRRNSTSSSEGRSVPLQSPPPPHSRPEIPPLAATDPAAPQTVAPPSLESPAFNAIRQARYSGDPGLVAEAVRDLIDHCKNPSVREYNCALEALRETRRPGEPLIMIMQTYNNMLKHSLLPNLRTYFELITAITDRDQEIFTTIAALEARVRRGTASTTDKQRIAHLRAENTFESAMKLFETVNTSEGSSKIPLYLYVALLRSCANHERPNVALYVFTALEHRTDIKPVASVYKHMIRAYTSPTEIEQAALIFDEFVQRSAGDGIDWNAAYDDPNGPRRQHLQVYNQMIEAHFRTGFPERAVALLDRMLKSPAPAAFGPADVPRPASSTYSVTIAGFIQSGEIDKALEWFEQLLAQTERPRAPYEAATVILRPDAVAWAQMLDALAFDGRVADLNRLFLVLVECAPKDGLRVRDGDRELVYLANVQRLSELSDAQAKESCDFLLQHVIVVGPRTDLATLLRPIWEDFVRRGMLQDALQVVEFLERVSAGRVGLQHPIGALSALVYGRNSVVPYAIARQLVRLSQRHGVRIETPHAARVLQAYAEAEGARPEDMDTQDWAFLIGAAVAQEIVASHRPPTYTFGGLVALLEDMSAAGAALADVEPRLIRQVVKTIFVKHGTDELRALFTRLGPGFARVLDDPEQAHEALSSAAASEAGASAEETAAEMEMELDPPVQRLYIDKMLGKSIEEQIMRQGSSPSANAEAAYRMSREGLKRQHAPTAFIMGKLIQHLGRQNMLDRVRDVYTTAQVLLRSLEADKQAQSSSWFAIENSMIIAFAHAGDLEAAHVHRVRILELGGAPSADAYGALILYVKDTTDDTSNALALFQEAQVHHVVPNQYLYNNIISKLAKARKADYALELFEQMKVGGITKPSSITYGAVIGACARVGDVVAAENLFQEMKTAPGYRPRVPPFNTMMQLYTTTKPNRERALHYYNELRAAQIAPTAYTYKLLMDAYGRIEPVEIETMEEIWRALRDDPAVEIQGNHFASLINAYGCVQKDLDKAIAVFASIPQFPNAPPRDALVFEAMINTLVAHRRTDLMPEYISLMHSEGVHMTAYIANFLIKGYADVGDMEQARKIFEGLIDPPSGIAAFNNHAPHEPSTSPVIDPMEPVYREPSTWEAMVRAELGSGNRSNAEALLARLRERCYPEAVFNRISGVLIDHSKVLLT
ncbi:hypothetical protein DFH07DRAFT_942104 [Mycena maculata]|uniref:PROP1-like PPR domain-containing protein n=1 Tax=Mycena maculata TaxID=230809 RepID=A0AAD7N6X5_9AGAR|nr:hypothetical protein DFH07DRAFT_942104 [Mycena maculata]